MREYYDLELKRLNDLLTEAGSLVETAIDLATKALLNRDCETAQKVKKYEKLTDEKEKEIQSLCFKLLLHQQPVAKDLRLVSSALKMITDMERIADQARDIADITRHLCNTKALQSVNHIENMAKETAKMVTNGIDAFVNEDIELARKVCEHDDVVDDLFLTVRGEIIEAIKENGDEGENALDLLMAAKYYERIADHAVNIAEWVIYSITGDSSVTDS